MKTPKTLYDKLWDAHVVKQGSNILYIDQHFIHEVTSAPAFESLYDMKRPVRRPEATLAVADHDIPTFSGRSDNCEDPEATLQLKLIRENTTRCNIQYFGYDDIRQGVVHVVGPEQGLTHPGMTIVCGDSHTSTHGAFGALAFGICTSEVEHVLATQTLLQKKSNNMCIHIENKMGFGVTAKDLILAIIGELGTDCATGHVIEFTGDVINNLTMEARMTVTNMAIEAGARSGLIAPDNKTYRYLKNRSYSPNEQQYETAVKYWSQFYSDPDAKYDKTYIIDAEKIEPTVTWGTSPEDVVSINGSVPLPESANSENEKGAMLDSIEYMGLTPGQRIESIPIDRVFIGSCTNGRIEDLREAAQVVKGKRVSGHINAMVVPGSGLVKLQAEQEGLSNIFLDAGFEWRESGCSMCLGMNPDQLMAGERCASTSNRNFKGRQGYGGRTHLVSPANAAAAAITGHLVDVRTLIN